MDAVGCAGLRFIHGGKVRDLVAILGSTVLVLGVCMCVCERERITELIYFRVLVIRTCVYVRRQSSKSSYV